MSVCAVPGCIDPVHCRYVCRRHYDHQLHNYYDTERIRRYMTDHRDAEHTTCTCPDARHDDWECPTCSRPSFSQGRIDKLRGMA